MLKLSFETPVTLEIQPARALSDKDLSCRILRLSKFETEISIAFLLDLMEVSRRGLHIEEHYPSLFSYVHEKLKLPKGSAYLRVQTMFALQEHPDLQDAIRDGSLSLSSIAKVQSFINSAEKKRNKEIKKSGKKSGDDKLKESEVQGKGQNDTRIPAQNVRNDVQSQGQNEDQNDVRNDVRSPEQNGKRNSALDNKLGPGISKEIGEVVSPVDKAEVQVEQVLFPPDGKIDVETKRKMFEQIIGKSTREAESVIANIGPTLLGESPERPRLVEKEVALSHGFKKISLVADDELVAMLDRLKEVTSHQSCQGSYLELLKKVCAIALQKLDPLEKAKRAQVRKEKEKEKGNSDREARERMHEGASQAGSEAAEMNKSEGENERARKGVLENGSGRLNESWCESAEGKASETLVARHNDGQNESASVKVAESSSAQNLERANGTSREGSESQEELVEKNKERSGEKPSRYIPAEENHELWLQSNGSCQRVDPQTGKICGKRTRMQRQHLVPFAKGGAKLEKMIFCQECNLKAAIVDFGAERMKEYLNKGK